MESQPLVNKNNQTVTSDIDERWMRLAIDQAKKARDEDEVPVGAIVVYQNQVIGVGYNQREKQNHITGHAEIIAVEEASRFLKSWRLTGCTLYVTLEPCLMCTGALIQSRIDRVVYGARDEKSGSIDSQIQFRKIPRIQHQPHIQEGVLVIECKALLTDYFSKKRHEKN